MVRKMEAFLLLLHPDPWKSTDNLQLMDKSAIRARGAAEIPSLLEENNQHKHLQAHTTHREFTHSSLILTAGLLGEHKGGEVVRRWHWSNNS